MAQQFLHFLYVHRMLFVMMAFSYITTVKVCVCVFLWHEDPLYVLMHYKTEPCRRPHRLCRQGYACPSYHSARDKRRSPCTHKYRSA